MWIEDESDGPGIGREAIAARETSAHARLAVYLQMVALIPILVVARSEQWGFAKFLTASRFDEIAHDVCFVLSLASFFLPVLIVVMLRAKRPRQRSLWAALVLSIALNVVQVMALLPAVS
jgi:hypothetical protein